MITEIDLSIKPPLFPLGQTCVTPGIADLMFKEGLIVEPYLYRHVHGDNGELCPEDKEVNRQGLIHGFRIFSEYYFIPPSDPDNKIKIYVITEHDRSVTTLLLPDEY